MRRCILAALPLFVVLVGALAPATLSAEKLWYPFPVEVFSGEGIQPPLKVTRNYLPLDKAARKWKIGVFLPHMKDPYFLAVNFGVVKESQRLGIEMQLFEAGGYDNLPVQIEQIRSAVNQGVDGVIVAAISYRGLDGLVHDLKRRGIPVIDAVNGMSSKEVSARALISFEQMAFRVGRYLTRRHPAGTGPIRVAWFPGPKGAGWVQEADKGLRRALTDSSVEIVATRFGDTGNAVQGRLVEEVLDTHSDIDYIVGTAVTAAAAVKILRDRRLDRRIRIVSSYSTPDVYREVKRGRILAAPTDSPVILGRIAVDQLVRILEHKPFLKHVAPRIQVIDGASIEAFDRSTTIAPTGFRPTYSVNSLLRIKWFPAAGEKP